MTELRIPFNRASLARARARLRREAVENGHISGDGPFTRRCEELLEEELGVARALLTTSCTHALELAALLLDVGPATRSSSRRSRSSPAPTRSRCAARRRLRRRAPDTLNLDERQLDELVGERRAAIVPTHYAGVGCELDAICAARRARRRRGRRGQRARALRRVPRPAARHVRRARRAELPRDEERHLRRGRRAARQRRALVERGGDHPREGHEPQAASSAARSTSTRGSTWARATCQSDLLAAFLAAQLEARERIQAARERSGSATTTRSPTGRRAGAMRAVRARPLRAVASTCTTCCCRRSRRARR